MSAVSSSRAVLRQSRFFLRRNNIRQASTTSEAATKVQEAGSNATSKASEGLSRVTSSAGSMASGAASSVTNAMSSVGGRTGRMISFVQNSILPPTLYYSRVGLELGKIMFQGQKWAPPSLSTITSHMQPMMNAMRNPRTLPSAMGNMSPEHMLSSVRNVSRSQMSTIALVGAEILGFFTVGEMIGRMKVVGYYGEVHHEH